MGENTKKNTAEEKTVYELIEEYVEKNAPKGATPTQKEKMVRDKAVALLRV